MCRAQEEKYQLSLVSSEKPAESGRPYAAAPSASPSHPETLCLWKQETPLVTWQSCPASLLRSRKLAALERDMGLPCMQVFVLEDKVSCIVSGIHKMKSQGLLFKKIIKNFKTVVIEHQTKYRAVLSLGTSTKAQIARL